MQPLPSNLTGTLFFWSNALYVLGALLTLASAALLVYARHARSAGVAARTHPLRDSVIVAPAVVCVLGSIAAVCFSGILFKQQRAAFESFRLQTTLELSRLRRAAEADTLAAERPQPPRAGTSTDSLGETVAFDRDSVAGVHSRTGAGDAKADARTDVQAGPRVDPVRQLAVDPVAAEPLRSFGGLRAVVESSPGDTEASQFADHLLLLLIASGVDARQGREQTVLQQLVGEPGIHLRYIDPNRGHDFAATLARLLRAQGLHVDVAPSWELVARSDTKATNAVSRDQLLISVGPQ